MQDLQVRELQRAVKFMAAIGCSFKVIAPNGEEFGELEVVAARQRAGLRYKRGAIRSHYKAQLSLDAGIGEVQVVDCGEFDLETIRGGISSMLTREWGKGTYTTSSSGTQVHVMRTA